MALVPPVEYAAASPAVHVVYDDIMATRKVDWINNFWKVLSNGYRIDVDERFRDPLAGIAP